MALTKNKKVINMYIVSKSIIDTAPEQILEITSDIENTIERLRENVKASDIIINAEDCFDIQTAFRFQLKFIFNETLTKPADYKKGIDKAIILLNALQYEEEVDAIKTKVRNAFVNAVPSIMSEDEAIKIINNAPNTSAKEQIKCSIIKGISDRKNKVRKAVTFQSDRVINVEANYQDGTTLTSIQNNKGVHIVNGEKGTGKSELLIELFKSEVEKGNSPMLMSASRALSSSTITKDIEKFYYKNIMANRDIENGKSIVSPRKGIIGVINTLLMHGDLEAQRANTSTLIIDEIEEVLNHISGSAVGQGTIQDQADYLRQLELMMTRADRVILTDALVSQNTIDILLKLVSKNTRFYEHKQLSQFAKPVIKYTNEAQLIEHAKEVSSKSKIGVFCDGSHSEKVSKLNATINSIADKKNHSLIDSNFMTDKNKSILLKDRAKFSKDNDIIFYNSAAKCGLSIKDADYKNTFLISCGTVNPNELVQSSARFRMAEEVMLAFSGNFKDRALLAPLLVAADIAVKQVSPSEITDKHAHDMLNDRYKKLIIDRIIFKNLMKLDYKNTSLVMFEMLGYKVEYIKENEEKQKKGAKSRRKGSNEEKEMRRNNVINAPKIDSKEATSLRDIGEYNSQDAKNKLESYNIRSSYNVTDIDLELMEFDAEGKGRTTIKNMIIARDGDLKAKTTEELVKQEMFKKFFELTGIDANDFGTYSQQDAVDFQEFIDEGKIQINKGMSMPAKTAFDIAFKDCSLCPKTPMKTISSILVTAFRLKKPANSGMRKQGKYIYIATKNETAEKYYTQVAGK